MRRPAQGSQKAQRGGVSAGSTTLPAPTAGWNTRDPIANMEPQYATIMDNWFPETNDVRLRKGFTQHVTGLTGDVETLMPYNRPDGTQALFAAANNSFYNVTSSGAVGAAVVSGLTNNRWNHENFVNSAGTSYLTCFNGVDSPRYWDGSSWTTITDSTTPGITGVTTSNLKFPFSHKRRMFIIEKDSLKLWYLPVDSVGGQANKFDLSGIATKGGYLVAGGTWTLDGGEGMDDHLVAITSEGQVIVYSGTNPASDYSLVGVWDLGEPLGERCLHKYGGDVLLMLRGGVYPLSAALRGTNVDPTLALTFNIQPTFTTDSATYPTAFGWQTIHFPSANMIITTIPKTDNFQQYVMNTVTGAWCRFTGINSKCWAILNGNVYFGSNGYVGQFWNGESDNGSDVQGDLRHAFSYLGALGYIKNITAQRPNILSDGQPTLAVGINTDYQNQNLSNEVGFSQQQYGTWGENWNEFLWGGALNFIGAWVTATGLGTAIAPRIKIESSGIEVRYQAMDLLYEQGTTIG